MADREDRIASLEREKADEVDQKFRVQAQLDKAQAEAKETIAKRDGSIAWLEGRLASTREEAERAAQRFETVLKHSDEEKLRLEADLKAELDAEKAKLEQSKLQMAGLRTLQQKALKMEGAAAVSGAARQLLFAEAMKNPSKKSSMSWRGADA